MNDPIHLEETCLGWQISVTAIPAGADYIVVISGGCTPHIGSVSTVFLENGRISDNTLLKRGHRDNVISQKFAKELSAACGGSVSAVCGIHYNNLSPSELEAVLKCTDHLLETLLRRVRR